MILISYFLPSNEQIEYVTASRGRTIKAGEYGTSFTFIKIPRSVMYSLIKKKSNKKNINWLKEMSHYHHHDLIQAKIDFKFRKVKKKHEK